MDEEVEDLKDELKLHLQSIGWETIAADTVVDGIVESFEDSLMPEGFATYDELAKNMGAGSPPLFDEVAKAKLDTIKTLVKDGD